MVLQDIIDEFDMDNNFEYLLGRYILFLERDGRFKHSSDPRAKIQFKSRLKKLNEEGETEGREYKKMDQWVQKQMFREQKIVEKNCFSIEKQNQKKILKEASKNAIELNDKLRTLVPDYDEDSEFMKARETADNALNEHHKLNMELTKLIRQRFQKLQKDYDDLLEKYIADCDSDSD